MEPIERHPLETAIDQEVEELRQKVRAMANAEINECLKKTKQYCMSQLDCDECGLHNPAGCVFEAGVIPAGWWLKK